MMLYACASCILGWTGMTGIAQASLRTRGFDAALGRALRMLIALVCMSGALGAWLLLGNVICCLSFSFACACMAALLVCDLREHILPSGLVAALLACALVFRVMEGGVTETIAIVLPTGTIAAIVLLFNYLRMHRGACELIGSGDVRMLVPLALFSGTEGLMCGVFACALLIGVLALVQLATGRADRHSHIALAPGLTAWLFAGTLLPLL